MRGDSFEGFHYIRVIDKTSREDMKRRAKQAISICGLALLLGCWPYAAKADCKPPPKPNSILFRDLKGVNLYVRLTPGKYVVAVDCHGREKQCTDEATYKSPESSAA